MANEIRFNGSITIAPDSTRSSWTVPISKSIDMTGTVVVDEVISITTAGAQISLGAIGTPGIFFAENRGVNGYLSYSHDNVNWGASANAGETIGPFRLLNSTPFLKVSSTTSDIRVVIAEA